MIIPVKFDEILASSLEDMWRNCWQTLDGQMNNGGWRTSYDHNSSHWAYGSGKLKKIDWDLKHKLKQTCHLPTVLPTKIDSDVIFCLQLQSKR